MWVVCMNAGIFDIPLYESESKGAAEIYYLQVRTMSTKDIELKPEEEVRALKEYFIQENILVKVAV